MAETITLPRSGVTALLVKLAASKWGVRTTSYGVLLGYSTDREQAILNADEDALKIRAALLPADARERVAKVLWSNAATIVDEMDQARRVADLVLDAIGGKP